MKKYLKNYLTKLSDLKGLANIGFADIIGSGATASFWFFIASQLNSDSYGEIHYYLGIAGLAQIISLIGNSNVLTVYAAKNVKIISTLFFVSLIAGFISSMVVVVLFTRIDAALLIFGYIIMDLSTGVLLGKKLFKKYSIFIILQKSLTLVLGIGFYFIFGQESIIFALVLSYLPYLIIIVKELKNQKITWKELHQRKGFVINNYSLGLSGSVSGQVDKIIIVPILGFELLGNYALALQFLIVGMMFSSIVYKFILSQDSSGIENKKLKKITIIVSIIIAIMSSILLPHIIPIFFPQYIQTIDAIQIISFSIIPGTITLVYTSKFLALEKSKNLLITKITSTIILILGFIFIGPILGIIGLSIVFVISASIEALLLVIMNRIGKNNHER